QTAPVDGKALLAKATLPTRRDPVWEIELAPMTRMQAWQVPEIKPGTALSVVGFTLREEKGEPVVRVEYLFVAGASTACVPAPPEALNDHAKRRPQAPSV